MKIYGGVQKVMCAFNNSISRTILPYCGAFGLVFSRISSSLNEKILFNIPRREKNEG